MEVGWETLYIVLKLLLANVYTKNALVVLKIVKYSAVEHK